MAERPHISEYMQPPSYRGDPIVHLPAGDELAAELSEAVAKRLERGERHVHPKRGGCPTCAVEAADTVVRYLERNTRVIQSEALAPDEFARARAAIKAMPYLGGRSSLRLKGELGADPDFPTVGDLLRDIETIRDGLLEVMERDRAREAELRTYRQWREVVRDLATKACEQFEMLDPGAGDA